MEQYIEFFTNNALLSVAWLGFFGWFIYSLISHKITGITSIPNAQAVTLINREDAQIFDIRPANDFRKGHIAGAKNVSPSKIEQNKAPELEKLKHLPIIVVCESGLTAHKTCSALRKQGFERVHLLKGGMTEWRAGRLPVAKK